MRIYQLISKDSLFLCFGKSRIVPGDIGAQEEFTNNSFVNPAMLPDVNGAEMEAEYPASDYKIGEPGIFRKRRQPGIHQALPDKTKIRSKPVCCI